MPLRPISGSVEEVQNIDPKVFRPVSDGTDKGGDLTLIQEAQRLLIARPVAAACLHEAIGRVLPLAQATGLGTSGVDEAAQGGRSTTALGEEPIPVAGKQSHFPRSDTEAGTPPAAWSGRLSCPTVIKIDDLAIAIVMGTDSAPILRVVGEDMANHFLASATGNAAAGQEGSEGANHKGSSSIVERTAYLYPG